jgi:hypothetical protein
MMITKAEAIKSLHPTAEFIYRHEAVNEPEITWISTDIPQPSDDAIAAEVARLEAEQAATQYQRDRAAEYPSIEALVVALWEGVVEERMAAVTALEAIRQQVKARYPKP